MMQHLLSTFFFLSLSGLLFSQPHPSPVHGGGFQPEAQACLSPQQRQDIQKTLKQSIHQLQKQGKLPTTYAKNIVLFSWPVRQANGFNYKNVYAISNYVDHNSNFSGDHNNFVTDYNCGNRSYDTGSGYNHQGIDIFTWPFSWEMMDNNQAEVVAAAPGTIIYKSDNNFDKNCSFNSSNWNAVYVQHTDGSVAWYGHLKSNTLTTKSVGQTVVAGEYLGVIGSSGNSTGPHLHFEVYDNGNNLIDPYSGSCNSLNNTTWWQAQKPYYESRLNTILTHSTDPLINNCYPDNSNISNAFMGSERVYLGAYYQDQLAGQVTNYAVYQPNNSLWTSWSHSPSEAHYSASYWYWSYILPSNPQNGLWRFSATFQGETVNHFFTVGQVCPASLTVSNPIYSTTYQAGGTLSSSGTVTNGTNTVFKAGTAIELYANFTIELGATLLATIETCGGFSENELVEYRAEENIAVLISKDLKISPNPVGHAAVLDFYLDRPQERVSIQIINMTGKMVQHTLSSHSMNQGHHRINLNASDLPNGIYFVQMQTSEEKRSIKIMVQQ